MVVDRVQLTASVTGCSASRLTVLTKPLAPYPLTAQSSSKPFNVMAYQTYPPLFQAPYYPSPAPLVDPFRDYYADRLRELTFNSRPLIQDLSVTAMAQRDQNNWEAMRAVVEEIEAATLRVCRRAGHALTRLGCTSPETTAALPHRFHFEECWSAIHHSPFATNRSPTVPQDVSRGRRSNQGEDGGDDRALADERYRRR